LTSSLLGNGSQKTSKDAFNEEIDFLGANINFSSQGASASALSKYAGRVLELLAEGALYPKFTQEEFDKDKAKIIEGLKANEKKVPKPFLSRCRCIGLWKKSSRWRIRNRRNIEKRNPC
ncbi:insulinase family protein, partial [Flavobacterium sp. LM5]|uniref:insulinase family protein n=1 Tax=Flavobacterium sp. LM5 TaxID=1938610 RepID=UPI001CB9819D